MAAQALPCRAGSKPEYTKYVYFFRKFSDFNKKLFNITKFKLKKYDFTLNNVIKIYLVAFLLMGRAMSLG
jgi:hypothetical protein